MSSWNDTNTQTPKKTQRNIFKESQSNKTSHFINSTSSQCPIQKFHPAQHSQTKTTEQNRRPFESHRKKTRFSKAHPPQQPQTTTGTHLVQSCCQSSIPYTMSGHWRSPPVAGTRRWWPPPPFVVAISRSDDPAVSHSRHDRRKIYIMALEKPSWILK